jgi:hypothetical protein
MRPSLFLLLPLTLLGACSPDAEVGSDPPVDASGTYTLSVYYGANGCGFEGWTEGSNLPGVSLIMTQDGAAVTGTVEGFAGAALALIHGSNVYTGTVDGNRLSMTIFGTIPQSQGNCSYTVNNRFDAVLEKDFITGRAVYEPAHNNNPDCAAFTCETEHLVNGTRPPSKD